MSTDTTMDLLQNNPPEQTSIGKSNNTFFEEPIKINRVERRKQLRFYLKAFKTHNDHKPSINIKEEDPEIQQKNIFRMQAWATKYGILLRKLDTLGYDFEKDSEGIHKQSVIAGRNAAAKQREISESKKNDLQELSDKE